MYEDVPELERRENLSADEFYESYLLPRRPVVLVGMKEFESVLTDWSFRYFREQLGDLEVELATYKRGFAALRASKIRLRDYIDGILENRWQERDAEGYPPPYLARWNIFDPLWCKKPHPMPPQYSLPAHFRNHCDFLPRPLLAGIVLQVFLGPAGTRTWLHQDALATHFWNVGVVGRKRWLLFPPEQTQYVYGSYGISPVDAEEPDFERFPLLRQIRPAFKVDQHPGDVVFAPVHWWHQVTSLSPAIGLSGNFTDRTTNGMYLRELVAAGVRLASHHVRSSVSRAMRRLRGQTRAPA